MTSERTWELTWSLNVKIGLNQLGHYQTYSNIGTYYHSRVESRSHGRQSCKSEADSPADSIPDGEIGQGSRTRRRAKDRAPIFAAWNWSSSRHFRFHRKWLARQFLSSRHEVTRFPFLLRHAVCYGRSGLDLLRVPFCSHGEQLGRPNSRGLRLSKDDDPAWFTALVDR